MWLLSDMHMGEDRVIAPATLTTLATIIVVLSSGAAIPVIAMTAGNTTTTTTSSSSLGLEFPRQPVWDEVIRLTGLTSINETHSILTFVGNGTMTVPDTEETINMTNNGYAILSPLPGDPASLSGSGREAVYSEDGDTLVMTFHQFILRDPAIPEPRGIIIAVFDRNATGVLTPFNGMPMVGTLEQPPNDENSIVRLWEWQSGTPLPTLNTSMEAPTLMNTTIR